MTVSFLDRDQTAGRILGRVTQATYTVPEVACLLGVGRSTVYEMLRVGEIPARKVGERWIISRRRFHMWLDGEPAGVSAVGGAP